MKNGKETEKSEKNYKRHYLAAVLDVKILTESTRTMGYEECGFCKNGRLGQFL